MKKGCDFGVPISLGVLAVSPCRDLGAGEHDRRNGRGVRTLLRLGGKLLSEPSPRRNPVVADGVEVAGSL